MADLSPDEAGICLLAIIKVDIATKGGCLPRPWVDASQEEINQLMDKLAAINEGDSSLEVTGRHRPSPHPCGGRGGGNAIEPLAALEHEQWAHWTEHLLNTLRSRYPLSDEDPDILRWRGQIKTPYAALTEYEKDSDRFWARKALAAATAPLVAVLSQEYRECCRQLRDPALVNPAWWVGRRCMIEDLTDRLAERGVVVLPDLDAARFSAPRSCKCQSVQGASQSTTTG